MTDLNSIHLNGKEDDFVGPADLLEMKQKLDSEVDVLEIAKCAGGQTVIETNEEDLRARILDLSEELVEESTKISWRNLLIKRIESLKFNETIWENRDKNPSYKPACLEQLELASEIMRIHKEIYDLEKTYASEKLHNLDLKHDNMALLQKLKDHQVKVKLVSTEAKKLPDYKKLQAEHEVKTMSVDINKNLITQIIIGAGMDWNSDPHLHCIMLNEEKP